MLRCVRHGVTGEVLFSTEIEIKLYNWLDDHANGEEYQYVHVSYQIAPDFRQAYLTRAQRHETWVLPVD